MKPVRRNLRKLLHANFPKIVIKLKKLNAAENNFKLSIKNNFSSHFKHTEIIFIRGFNTVVVQQFDTWSDCLVK